MIITSNQIRQELRQWDSFLRRNVSGTQSILDPVFDVMPDREQLLKWCAKATQSVVDKFREFDPVAYAGLTKDTLYQLWEAKDRDCEDITMWAISFLQMEWSLTHDNNPAMFRCVVQRENKKTHSVGLTRTVNGWRFVEFQNLTVWEQDKVLAVA